MFTKRGLVFVILLMLFQNMAMSQKLKIGDKAPDFETTDTNGNTIKLSNFKGQKVVSRTDVIDSLFAELHRAW